MACELTVVLLFVITLVNFFAFLNCHKSTIKKASKGQNEQATDEYGGEVR